MINAVEALLVFAVIASLLGFRDIGFLDHRQFPLREAAPLDEPPAKVMHKTQRHLSRGTGEFRMAKRQADGAVNDQPGPPFRNHRAVRGERA